MTAAVLDRPIPTTPASAAITEAETYYCPICSQHVPASSFLGGRPSSESTGIGLRCLPCGRELQRRKAFSIRHRREVAQNPGTPLATAWADNRRAMLAGYAACVERARFLGLRPVF